MISNNIIYEGYFNDHQSTSDEITTDIEQTTSISRNTSQFILELSFSFNKTTVECNPTMFQKIYHKLEATLPNTTFIDDFQISEVISTKGTTDEKSSPVSSMADFLVFVNDMLQEYQQDYYLSLVVKFNINGLETFNRFCKDLYNIWRCGARNSIRRITVSQDDVSQATVSARVSNTEFVSQVDAIHLYNFIFKGSDAPTKDNSSVLKNMLNWNLHFNKHQKVPFFNHLLYMCNHSDSFKDFKCDVYGYSNFNRRDLEHGSVKVYYLYITLTPKDSLFNNTRSMFSFCRDYFVDCLKERDCSQFIDGNITANYYIVCFRSSDRFNTRQNAEPACDIFHKFEHFQYPLHCMILYCRDDWSPYDPNDFALFLSAEDIETSHRRLEFTLNKNRIQD